MSPESVAKLQQIAGIEGQAYIQAVEEFFAEHPGKMVEVGHMLIAVTSEPAEGWWEKTMTGDLRWRAPEEDENQHVEVFVMDRDDHRFIPGLTPEVTIIDPDGDEVGTKQHRLYWHPMILHYGENWQIPEEGNYFVRVRIEVPDFRRHKEDYGRRFSQPVDAEFDNLHMKPGRR